MTAEELNAKYTSLTGLTYTISDLIEKAETEEEKKKVYDTLSWNIKAGLVTDCPDVKELIEEILPEIESQLGIESSTIEPVEDDVDAGQPKQEDEQLTPQQPDPEETKENEQGVDGDTTSLEGTALTTEPEATTLTPEL